MLSDRYVSIQRSIDVNCMQCTSDWHKDLSITAVLPVVPSTLPGRHALQPLELVVAVVVVVVPVGHWVIGVLLIAPPGE